MLRYLSFFFLLSFHPSAFAASGYEALDFVHTVTKTAFDEVFDHAEIPSPLDIYPGMPALECIEGIGAPSVEAFNTSTAHFDNTFYGMPWGRTWTFTPAGYFYSGEIFYDRPGSVVEKTMRIVRDRDVFIVKEKVVDWGTGWPYSTYIQKHPEGYVVCGPCSQQVSPRCPQ